MVTLLSFEFRLFALVFLVACFFSWYIPGRVALRLLLIRDTDGIVGYLISMVLGLVLWGMQGYVLGYLKLRFLTYIYLVLATALWIPYRSSFVLWFQNTFRWIKQHTTAFLLIVFGSIMQLIFVAGSGLTYDDGIRFYGINGHDGIMHVAFIRSLMESIPPVQPGAYDLFITNYHYWSNLVLAETARIWHIPILPLFFQYSPFVVALLSGIAVYALIVSWGGSNRVAMLALFFFYFGGDVTYLITLLMHRNWGSHVPLVDNGVTQLLNMPQAMAELILITGLISLHRFIKTNYTRWIVVTVLLLSVLIGFKVYYGIYVIFGFGFLVFVRLMMSCLSCSKESVIRTLSILIHKEQGMLYGFVLLVIISLFIYIPVNSNAGGLFYAPLEWPKLFLGPGAIDWQDWWLRRQVYEAASNIRNLFILDAVAVGIALLAIHGTRLIGFFGFFPVWRRAGWQINAFLMSGVILFHLLGLFTLQSSGGYVVYYFFVVATGILGIYVAFALDSIASFRPPIGRILLVLLLILTIPRAIIETGVVIRQYIREEQFNLITKDALDAFSFLKYHTPPGSIVQSHRGNEIDSRTPLVYLFTGRHGYLTGTLILEVHHQPIEQRKKALQQLFLNDDSLAFARSMYEKNISYIYLEKKPSSQINFEPDRQHILPVYENDEVMILTFGSVLPECTQRYIVQ
ncbi:hypothetical protein HY468_03765 [Candidatus Roizmanbacteria bacterium]|nr:hypothetical protein [Candidatus Roizmanbacteria bacterium]